MSTRIIPNPDAWEAWGAIAENTTVVDDYGRAYQYDHHAWYATGDETDTDTRTLSYPVQVVWTPTDRDLNTWPNNH